MMFVYFDVFVISAMDKLKGSYREPLISKKLWPGMDLKCIFFLFVSWTEGNSCKFKPRKKPFLFYVYEQICVHFRKFSKRTNVDQNFFFFTFASQCKLCELLSYGEYNQLFISVICFLKTTHLSVHRLNSLIFFSCWINSTHIIFLLLK